MTTAHRIESDSLGRAVLSAEAYWGIHTARAIENFSVSGRTVHPRLIDALVRIKRAAAVVNARTGRLDGRRPGPSAGPATRSWPDASATNSSWTSSRPGRGRART